MISFVQSRPNYTHSQLLFTCTVPDLSLYPLLCILRKSFIISFASSPSNGRLFERRYAASPWRTPIEIVSSPPYPLASVTTKRPRRRLYRQSYIRSSAFRHYSNARAIEGVIFIGNEIFRCLATLWQRHPSSAEQRTFERRQLRRPHPHFPRLIFVPTRVYILFQFSGLSTSNAVYERLYSNPFMYLWT